MLAWVSVEGRVLGILERLFYRLEDPHPSRLLNLFVILPSRYLPDRPLPQHTHVPGQSPRAAEEDLFGESEQDLFCWGVDLFNGGCYWEAHETWESLWHAAGRVGPTADFLKGLIKLAAAGVKLREGRPAGLRRHAERARELFADLSATDTKANWRRWGLPPEQLARWAERIAVGELVRWDELRASSPGRPARIFDFELQPQIGS